MQSTPVALQYSTFKHGTVSSTPGISITIVTTGGSMNTTVPTRTWCDIMQPIANIKCSESTMIGINWKGIVAMVQHCLNDLLQKWIITGRTDVGQLLQNNQMKRVDKTVQYSENYSLHKFLQSILDHSNVHWQQTRLRDTICCAGPNLNTLCLITALWLQNTQSQVLIINISTIL